MQYRRHLKLQCNQKNADHRSMERTKQLRLFNVVAKVLLPQIKDLDFFEQIIAEDDNESVHHFPLKATSRHELNS